MTSLSYEGALSRNARSTRASRSRRTALSTTLALLASALVVPLTAPASTAQAASTDFTQFVNPFIGTSGDHGQDGPGAIAPYGLATVTPATTNGNHVGYEYTSNTLLGFTNVALDGVGGGGGAGDVLVVPTYQTYTARPATSSYNKAIRTDGGNKVESATAGYYQAGLDESGKNIDAQVTAATRTGVHDYAFGTAGHAALVIDLQHTGNGRKATELKIGTGAGGNTTISGSFTGYFYNSSYKLYYYAETTVPTSSVQTWGSTGLGSATSQVGTDIGVVLNFAATAGAHIGLRVTLSPVSAEQAKRDASVEVGGKTFDEIRAATKAEWNERLGKVEVDATTTNDPSGDLKTQFYTHLYRLADTPMNATSTDGTYRGADGNIYRATGYTHYDSWSLWDDFHKYAAVASVYPEVYRDVVQSLVDLYAEVGVSGKSSVGSLLQSVPTVRWERAPVVVADAVSKGVRLQGLEQAYPALVAQVGGSASLTNLDSRAGGLLGYSYDAYGLSVIADAIGKTSAAATYRNEAARWAKAFNRNALTANSNALAATGVAAGVDKVGLMMPRSSNSDTAAFTDTDPEAWQAAGLYQGTLWQYNWYDAQDLGGMIEMMGGRANAAKSVNYFFGNHVPDDCSRNLHLFANEISVHAPFLFNYVGQPAQTQDWTYRTVTEPVCTRYTADGSSSTASKKMVFQNSPTGLLETMDNDAGTMSGYFVSSAIGLYPVMAGGDTFQITTPIFDRTTVHYAGGKDFVVEAPGVGTANHYIQSATFNGKPLNRTWLTAAELNAGGVLHFTMGSQPSSWGADGVAEDSLSDHVSSALYDSSRAVVTRTQVFEESPANDGSIGNAITVSLTDATFTGETGADLTSEVTAAGVPAGLTLKATRTGASSLDLTLTGKANSHLADDSTDNLVVTFSSDAFSGATPSADDREVTLKVRFAGHSITPSTTTITAGANGSVSSTVELTLGGGAVFAGTTGSALPTGAVTFPGLDAGVTAVVTRTGAATARIAFSGTLTSTSSTRFTLLLADTALTGAVASQVTGPGTTAIDPFTLSPASTTRADLQALYDDARLVGADSYSASSFAALTAAVARAKTALGDADASEYVLSQALATLQAAIDGLQIGEGGYRLLQAEGYDRWSGGTLKTESGGSGTNVGGVSPGSWLSYRGIDFSEAPLASVVIDYSHNPGTASASSAVELRTGSATGPLVTTIALPTTNGWANYTALTHTFTAEEIAKLDGVNDLYFVFTGTLASGQSWVANLDWFQFQVSSGDGGQSFTFTQLTPNNVTTVGPNLGRDGSAGAYTNFGNTHNEEWIKYAAVDFGPNGADTFSFNYDKPSTKSQANTWIDLRLGSATGTTVAASPALANTSTGGTWGTYVTSTMTVNPSVFKGTQDVFVVFRMNPVNTNQSAPYVANFRWFQFGDSTVTADTSRTVQFESIRSGYGMLNAADSGLVSGTDYSGADLKTEAGSVNGQLAGTKDGAWVRYQNVNLGSHYATSLSVRYDAPATKVVNGRLAVYVDAMTGDPFVTVALPATGSGWGTYQTVTVTLPSELTGNHAIYFALQSAPTADQPYVGNLDWFALGYGVDKGSLHSAIAKYSELASDGELYLAADFAVFTRALAAAEAVVAAPAATAAEVKTALRQLNLSAGQLQWKVIKQVADWITKAEAVDEIGVTPSSYAALRTAITAAKALDRSTSSHDDYSSALSDLTAAYGNLHVVYTPVLSVPTVDPGTPAEVTGSGFASDEVVTFSWTQSPALTESWTATADADGDVTTTVTIPRATADGSYQLRAVGATSAAPVTSAVSVVKVMRPSQTDFLAVPVTINEGQDLTVQIGVTAGAIGTVDVFDGTKSLGTATLDGESKASITVAKLAAGEHALTAAYSGDDWYRASTSAGVTVTVKAVVIPPVQTKVTVSVPVLDKSSQAYGSTTSRRATIATTVTGTTSGKVTFAFGSKVLGTAPVIKGGSLYRATLPIPATLPLGSYTRLTATVVTGPVTVSSVASAATFRVVKATTSKVQVSGKKFRRGSHPKVTVTVAALSSGQTATGKVKVYVGGKVVRTVRLTAGKNGRITVTLPKRYYKAIQVKAEFVPTSTKTVEAKTSKTVKIKTKR
jgi:predicted alpha-1,2-mannosidase